MMRSATLARAMAPVALIIAAACAPATESTAAGGPGAAVGASAEVIAEGQRLFQGDGRCSLCHGATGAGGRLGPNLIDEQWIWIQPTSSTFMADLVTIIRNGVPNPRQSQSPMPPMGGAQLTQTQIDAIAAYVASL